MIILWHCGENIFTWILVLQKNHHRDRNKWPESKGWMVCHLCKKTPFHEFPFWDEEEPCLILLFSVRESWQCNKAVSFFKCHGAVSTFLRRPWFHMSVKCNGMKEGALYTLQARWLKQGESHIFKAYENKGDFPQMPQCLNYPSFLWGGDVDDGFK